MQRVKVRGRKAERHVVRNVTAAFGSREAVARATHLCVAVVIKDVAAALVCAPRGCGWRRGW